MASKIIQVDNMSFNIIYEIQNIYCDKSILFLHGWGSNKEIMKQGFMNELSYYKHIYIDMPGFGKTENNFSLNTNDYARIIKEFLYSININPYIIVGHSFGGKVATLLNPPLLVLLSSAGIIENKSKKILLTIRMAKIFNKFGLNKVTKLLRSNDVNMKNENMYETFKNVIDEDFSENFKNYKGKAKLFWGEYDTATSLNSGKIIHKLIANSEFYFYDDDHYFFLRHCKDICKKMILDNY
jgi:surfactin synthase thioesterase subunit